MGTPMARNLLRAGHRVWLWNRNALRAQALAELHDNARVVAEPAQAAHGQVLFSMLADDASTRQVLLERGVLEALPAADRASLIAFLESL